MNKYVSKVMKDNGLDAIIFTNCYNIRYLTGYTGDTGVLVVTAKKCYLLTDFRYIFQAENEAKGAEVADVAKLGYSGLIKQIFADNGVKAAGFEGEHIMFSQIAAWKKKCRGVKFFDVDEALAELRIIKTADELEKLKMAEHIGDLAFEDILKYLKPGVTELEIAARLERDRRRLRGRLGIMMMLPDIVERAAVGDDPCAGAGALYGGGSEGLRHADGARGF